jgi:WD40 repeat protein
LSCVGVGGSEDQSSVEAVSFCPETSVNLVVTGTLSGKISCWDIPTQIERQSYDQSAGVVKLVWHPKHTHLLFSAGLDGVVRLIDSRSGTLVREYRGHTADLLDISVSL